jgi:hypothetical protein
VVSEAAITRETDRVMTVNEVFIRR